MQKILIILIILSFFLSSFSYSQKTIAGKVIDKNTHESLESAVISDSNSNINSLTGRDGYFILKNVGNEDLITVRYMGYSTQKINAGTADKAINISA